MAISCIKTMIAIYLFMYSSSPSPFMWNCISGCIGITPHQYCIH